MLGMRLSHIVFYGPNIAPASLEFGPGLNVLYGASETGKSFVVEAIDFMLGGKPPLRDIQERVGYDRILLGIETIEGEQYTLMRSTDGGGFRVYGGRFLSPPSDEIEARVLGEKHTEKNPNNISTFLLECCGLRGKRIRRNNNGLTNSLTFRYLARLVIVTETEITEQRSPLLDGNPIANTPNFATFKLLLTGVDDTSLVPNTPKKTGDQSLDAQIELLDQLLEEYRERLEDLTNDPEDLENQLRRIEDSISQHTQQLSTTEADYHRLVKNRRQLRDKLEEGYDRRSEITSLIERFSLLDRHYASDIARLKGIEEAGTLFEVLGKSPCPLCGAAPEFHRQDTECDGDVNAVVIAARSEIAKVELLRTELAETFINLKREATGFDKRLPKIEQELKSVADEIDRLISPKLTKLRNTYSDFADKKGEVREALSIFRRMQDIERRRNTLEGIPEAKNESVVSNGDVPISIAGKFAQVVEKILKDWNFPDADRVFFDAKQRDLVISNKLRTARGKGLRAITHAAFTIALLEYCRLQSTLHPGFVILDSPLLAYRAPEGPEDDLTGTDLNEKFYAYLYNLPTDRQVIIVENTDPPPTIATLPQVTMFSKNPHSGRYGFFSVTSDKF